MKRLFDVLVSGMALLLLSLLFLGLALLIKLTSKGPVFYRGERIGLGGRLFRIFKFRSMVVEAEQAGGPSTSGTDPRVTRIGHIIRKFKLDELSQLINVFLGDMSLVGPRPEVKHYVDMYTEEEKAILTVRPGITDWSSIKFHNEGEIIASSGLADPEEAYMKLIRPEKLQLQLKYVREHSFVGDIGIILVTLLTLMKSRLPPPRAGQVPSEEQKGPGEPIKNVIPR
ncbi:MAG: sugar transferase [Planctomycetota bacterium]|nr:sugar transferase [Planctomycetota bacterium]